MPLKVRASRAALPFLCPCLPLWLQPAARDARTRCAVLAAARPPADAWLSMTHAFAQDVDTCWPVRTPIRYYLSSYGKVSKGGC